MNKDTTDIELKFISRLQHVPQGREPIVSTVTVPKAIADVCHKLARRGRHGVLISTIGGRDALADFALHDIPVRLQHIANRGTRGDSWLVPEFDLVEPETAA